MKLPLAGACVIVAVASVCGGAEKTTAAPPSAPRNESLHYAINWPSGLSLGESQLAAHGGQFQFTLDADVPGYPVHDQVSSTASPDFCSASLEKHYLHGHRKSDEKITFDAHRNTAERETVNGGKSEIQTSPCAKDPLTYLEFLRHELSLGRLPAPQAVVFGAVYQVRVAFVGTETVKLADKTMEADKLTASLKGPSSDVTFEIYFSKDPARTPLLVKVPLPLATFSMELVR